MTVRQARAGRAERCTGFLIELDRLIEICHCTTDSQVGESREGRDGVRDDTLQPPLKHFEVHAPAPQASCTKSGQGRVSIESARVMATHGILGTSIGSANLALCQGYSPKDPGEGLSGLIYATGSL